MRTVLMLAVASACTACVASDGEPAGRLEVTGPKEFRFTTVSSVIHPLDSEQAEHHRLIQLDARLRAAHLCPAGYRIVARVPPMGYGEFNKKVNERVVTPVAYSGECTDRTTRDGD